MYENRDVPGTEIPRLRNELRNVQEKRWTEMQDKLQTLSVAVSTLESEIDMIGSALTPVIAPRPAETPGNGIATAPSVTPLGNAIQNEIDRLFILSARLRSIRESLGV